MKFKGSVYTKNTVFSDEMPCEGEYLMGFSSGQLNSFCWFPKKAVIKYNHSGLGVFFFSYSDNVRALKNGVC